MFTKQQILSFLKYSIAGAIIYLISVVIFLMRDSYTQIYILYLGNVLFAVAVVVFVVRFSKKRDRNAKPRAAISAGIYTTIMGVIISVLAIFIILAIMEPSSYTYVTNTASELSKPASALEGNGYALLMIVFLDAIIGNLGTGIFVSAMLPNMLKTDQSGETSTILTE